MLKWKIPYSVIKQLHEEGFEEIETLRLLEWLPEYKKEDRLYHPKTEEGERKFSDHVIPEYEDIFENKD